MDCKLSKDSLIELQLIPRALINDETLCPCCGKKIVEHRYGRRIQSIPLTRHNICPRMKRASRKSSIIGIFVSVIVSLVIFVLGIYLNYLVSVRNEIFQGRINFIEANKKNLAITNRSLTIDDSNQTNNNYAVLFTILLFVFLLVIITIVILFVYMCLSKSVSQKKGIPVPIGVYTSVATQIPQHESDFISS